jgi:5'-nucleotidase
MPHAKFNFYLPIMILKTMMDGLVKPYKIFNKNGIKVGVLELELDGLVDKKCTKKLSITILLKQHRK